MTQSISSTRDGFQLKRDHFTLPENLSAMDPKTKRAFTICNLFLNHRLGLHDIVRLLDEDEGSVVVALLEHGIIQDRRNRLGEAPDGKERRASTVHPRKDNRLPRIP